jgi:hypothetical protein
MSRLYLGIKTQYPDIKSDEFVLQDDGQGVYIKSWDFAGAPQPDLAETLALEALGQAEFNNIEYKLLRDAEMPSEKEMRWALWKKIMRNDSTEADALDLIIQAVEKKYPPP